jgi:dipeptidyl aminopeptidase/acylaminoacyl peptidase
MRKVRKPTELVQFSRTGHSILIEEHELEFYARLLKFLGENIGPGTTP